MKTKRVSLSKLTKRYDLPVSTWASRSLIVLGCVLMHSVAVAQTSPNAKWFRYYENGVPQVSHTVTNAHLKHGYEELDASFRVIKKVTPHEKVDMQAKLSNEEKVKAEEMARRKLLRTYGSSERAVRKRTQLLADTLSKRSFAQQQLHVAVHELNAELSKAAAVEKSGKPVSEVLRKNLETKRAAVTSAEAVINDLVYNQMQSVDALTLDIRKLRKIERTARGN